MKVIFDRTAALLGLVILSPLLVVVAILVRILLGSPVLFRQERPGLHARPFTLMKFRTMHNAADHGGREAPTDARELVLTDGERLTTFGSILRRASIDELPQLLNVLRGELSLVGPRPLLVEYLPLYTPEQARRHEVRPGITGWAQVNGRNALTWEEKFALDVWYVDNRSFLLDMKILAHTVGQTLAGIFGSHGINQPGQATAAPFTGSGTEAES